MRASAIILAVAVTAACSPALAQVVAPQATPQGTPNVVNPGGDLQLPYFYYDHLHDELQFAGGELPNQVLHSDAANSQSQPQLQSNPYSQCDTKYGVPDG